MTDTTRDGDKVTRATFPTASFSVKTSHIAWIARRAKSLGVSKSEFVRGLFDKAMREEERAA